MFSTLSITYNDKKSLILFEKRRFITHEHRIGNLVYYTTLLKTTKRDNTKQIERFKVRSKLPIITEDCREVRNYKYIILAKKLISSQKPIKSVGICDSNAALTFLPEILYKKIGFIKIFTENISAYNELCNEIYRCSGTPIFITNKMKDLNDCEIIFSAKTNLIIQNVKILTEKNADNLKITLPPNIECPKYCNPLLIAAGLYFYGGKSKEKNLIKGDTS